MGYSTDFIGHVDVTPVLNEQERAYLRAFSDSRRCSRPGGPYEVPGNPAAEYDDPTLGPPQTNELADDQPGYWCDWVPCLTGCCLAYNGHEKFYQATRWMQYLIDHFLKPDAFASRSTLSWFKEFTFDHRADGFVAGCRRDNKEWQAAGATTKSCS